MKKVPTWLAINSFATGRFNQLDDTLPAEDRCRAKTRRCSQAANQLEFTLGWSSTQGHRQRRRPKQTSCYRCGSRGDPAQFPFRSNR